MKTEKKKNYQDLFLQYSCLLLGYSVILAVISGLLCACYYIPIPAGAALSIAYMQEYVFAGAVILLVHKLSCGMAIVSALFHFVVTLFNKKLLDNSAKPWQAGIICIVFLIALAGTGYILSGTPSALGLVRSMHGELTNTECCTEALPALVDTLSFVFVRIYLLHCFILPILTGGVVFRLMKNRCRMQKTGPISGYALFIFVTAGIVILAVGITLLNGSV